MSSGYEDAEEEDISPPGSLSTPLKKAFSRYRLLLLPFLVALIAFFNCPRPLRRLSAGVDSCCCHSL